MTLSAASALHYWSARYGPTAIVGGKPSHSRSSAGAWDDQQGAVQTAIVNTPRFRWSSVSGERRAVYRHEQSRTNSLTWSQQLEQAPWATTRASVSTNQTLAPDGTLTADKLVEDASVTTTHLIQQAVGGTASSGQAISIFAKAAGRTWIGLSLIDKGGNDNYCFFDIVNGVKGNTGGAGFSGASIEPFGNGWFRCTVLASSGVGGGTPTLRVYLSTGNSGSIYTGDGASGVYLWGGQFEVDAVCATAYIFTTSTTATRSADTFYWDYAPVPQAAAWYTRFIERGTCALSGGTRLWEISSAAGGDPRLLIHSSASLYKMFHHNGATFVESALVTAPAIGDTVELLGLQFADASVQLIMSINGAAVTTAGASAAHSFPAAYSGQRLYVSHPTSGPGVCDYAELKAVKFADLSASTNQGRMDEMRAYELTAAGELIS